MWIQKKKHETVCYIPRLSLTQLQEKRILHGPLCRLRELVGAYIFSIHNNTLLCIVDYYSKFPIMKKADGLSADDLFREMKIVFTQFGLPKKVVSDYKLCIRLI